MELKEFVTDVLQQINDGVIEAQKAGVYANPRKEHQGIKASYIYKVDGEEDQSSLQIVDFEVGLTNEVGSGGGKFGVSFAGISVGVAGGGNTSTAAVTRIRFSIPLLLPVYKDHNTKD